MPQPLEPLLGPVRAHFDRLLATGTDTYGPAPTAMWMASLDTRTGRYPEDDSRLPHIGKRVYRNIDAPRGCSLYWDQPSLVAAHTLSRITGDARYSAATDAYVFDFLERCISPSGRLLWGNHYYYDAFRDVPVRFAGEEPPQPCGMAGESGSLHELRPIPVAWDTLWRVSPQATERAIRCAVAGHLVDPQTGEFNRHADGRRGCAFLEAGGILIEALAWLWEKVGAASLLDTARRIARFSFQHRDPNTGLLENNPTVTRWDKHTATTEVGLWGGCLIRAGRRTGVQEWQEMADEAVCSWLRWGWHGPRQRYYGRLHVATGQPILDPKETPYQPGDYSDLWEPLFPAHDYPMPFAECCLELYRLTGKDEYRTACLRWVEVIARELPARAGSGGYAEHYGRCAHFLLGCADSLQDDRCADLARQVMAEAMAHLFEHGMFRGHPGEDRYDAVDGVGFLALALIRAATGREPDLMGMGW